MYLTYPYFPAEDLYSADAARGQRLPSRMDVQRSYLEEKRMSHVSSEHELHAQLVATQRVEDALRAARLREARAAHPDDVATVNRLRAVLGNLLIGMGESIRPAPRAPQRRVIIPRAPRNAA